MEQVIVSLWDEDVKHKASSDIGTRADIGGLVTSLRGSVTSR